MRVARWHLYTTMSDEGHRKIDQAYDFAERVVEGVGRVLGVDVHGPHDSKAPKIATMKNANPLPAASDVKALPAAPPPPFRIAETIDENGVKTWAVTNGIQSADCKSREFAEQVLAAIEAGTKSTQAPSRFAGGGRGSRRL